MTELKGKKLLILGGAFQHCKLVRAAKELGVYTIVTDYLKDSPAKQLADQSYMYNIKDVDELVALCKKEHVDGILHGYIDPCQRPYSMICDQMKYHCFGSSEQYFTLTDKHAFKRLCAKAGVDTIEEYKLSDFYDEKKEIKYPVFVKPVDSRGSRGMTICSSVEEVERAVELAKTESSNGDILIERYFGGYDEFQVTYFFINGRGYLLRTADRYLGDKKLKLDKVGICTVSPSCHTTMYLDHVHEKVLKMLQTLGIKNGPVFMQGFVDGDTVRFFDPGMRFPGGDYENLYKEIFDIDLMKQMVIYALTGAFTISSLPFESVNIKDKKIALLFPTIKEGKIQKIVGMKECLKEAGVQTFFPRYYEGDVVPAAYNVNQRFAEIDIIGEGLEDLKEKIKYIQQCLKVVNEHGQNMIFGEIDVKTIKG